MRIADNWKASFISVTALLALLAVPALAAAKLQHFMTDLSGAQETPTNQSAGLGNGLLTWDTSTKTLCFYISFIGLGTPETAAHIHGPAVPGVPAGIVLALPVGTGKQACVVNPPLPFNVKELQKNLYYVNIHSVSLPAGEIRGQILRIK